LALLLKQGTGKLHLSGSPPKSGLVELQLGKKFAFLFCGTKGLGEDIIKPGCFVKLLVFVFATRQKDFCHLRQIQESKFASFSGRAASKQVRIVPY